MCNHKYLITSFQSPKTCYMQEIFEQNKNQFSGDSFPLDEGGLCVFHSKNWEWKTANGIEKYFYQFFDIMSKDRKQKEIDFRGLILNTEQEEGITLEEVTTYKTLNFCDTHFREGLTFKNCHFGGDLYLDAAVVVGIFIMEHCTFSDNFTAIQKAEFHATFYLTDCTFSDLFDVQTAQFLGQVNFTDVNFNGYTVFDQAVFKSKRTGFSYFKSFFNDYTSFKGTVFHDPVQFEHCIFNGETQFVGTLFKREFYFALPEIKANIFFKGTSEKDLIFENEIEMQLNAGLFEGAAQMVFENANLVFLDRTTKNKLPELKANRQVVLGKGTMVFRVSFREKYPYSDLNEIFISDLLQTIKQYFSKKWTKHFEFVVSSEDDIIYITFYSDDFTNIDDFKSNNIEAVKDLSQGVLDKDNQVQYLQEKFNFQLSQLLTQINNNEISSETLKVLGSVENLTIVMNSPTFKNCIIGGKVSGRDVWLGDGKV